MLTGAAARGEVWKYYDLGYGFCTNPFWADCAHRMACAKCPYYRPKDSLKDQLIEGKTNLVRMPVLHSSNVIGTKTKGK